MKNKRLYHTKMSNYIFQYKKLNKLIKQRENEIILGRGPTIYEWQKKKNTVEGQAIELIEDKKMKKLISLKNKIEGEINKLKKY